MSGVGGVGGGAGVAGGGNAVSAAGGNMAGGAVTSPGGSSGEMNKVGGDMDQQGAGQIGGYGDGNINIDNSTNIVINNYGSENRDYVTLKKVKELIEDNYKTAIQELVKLTHFNEDYPENHNIAITNIKSKYGYIYNNGMYEIKIVNKILEELLDRNRKILEKTYDNKHVKKKMKDNEMNDRFERWLDKIIDNETLQKLVLDDLYTTIVNLTKKFKINVN